MIGYEEADPSAQALQLLRRHIVEEVVIAIEEIRHTLTRKQLVKLRENTYETRIDGIALPARPRVNDGVERIEQRRLDVVGGEAKQRVLHSNQSLQTTISFASDTSVSLLDTLRQRCIVAVVRQTPQHVRVGILVVRVRARDEQHVLVFVVRSRDEVHAVAFVDEDSDYAVLRRVDDRRW